MSKQKLIASLISRIGTEIAERSSIHYLTEQDINEYYSVLVSTVYLYTRPKKGYNKQSTYFAEIIAAIGHNVRNKLKLKRDSGAAAKTGAFLLYSFEALGMLKVILAHGVKHATYVVQVLDDDAISALWNSLASSQIVKLPSDRPFSEWTTTKHETGIQMIKTGNLDVARNVTVDTHPILFECLNRSQQVGWQINKDVYDIHTWALRNKTDAFSEIWEATNLEARATKLREAKAIGDIARRFVGKTFYHLYYYDFRGRKYPTSAYLHEQGSDLARGLLLRSDSALIGKEGYKWLMISLASNWAGESGRLDGRKTDKIPLVSRFEWATDNEEILLSYAESPKVNQGWMQADKPWQFLAACFELKKFREWQYNVAKDFDNYDYPSHLEAYIDGSNNGCQHLAALTKDESAAVHVNLIASDLPGDLYSYVGEHVWGYIADIVGKIPKDELKKLDKFIDNLIDLKKQINAAEVGSDRRAALVESIKTFKAEYDELAQASAPVYWNRVASLQQRRKIVKRGVMTIPYGGTPFGLGEQVISDAKKHGIELLLSMEHRWGAWLGRVIFTDCQVSLAKLMQLLSLFEAAGQAAEDRGEFLSWTVPITNFPVVQNYTEGTVKKVYVQYGPQLGPKNSSGYYNSTYQISICFIENVKPSKGKQAQGASPNAIHSLDAAHLALTTHNCSFPITTIHDSFGCLLADMPELFRIVRESFVQLYDANPIKIINEMGGSTAQISFGNLDLKGVPDSEYCFA